jgi:hypothetical protein
MSNAKPPCLVPIASVKAILDAARPAESPPPEKIEATRLWLEKTLARAIKRASAKPIVMKDVERLEIAFRRFQAVIESLQDRDNPPPRVPISHGTTDWDHWLVEYHHFPFKRGRRPGTDWKPIGALLALYEVTSGRRASAAQPNGPTMRFLDASLGELAGRAPADLQSHLDPPSADALKQQLARRRRLDISRETKKLDDALRTKRQR